MKKVFFHFTYLVHGSIDSFILLNQDQLQIKIFYVNTEVTFSYSFKRINQRLSKGVYPDYWSVINDLVCPVPESVWLYLSEK